jgi:hypothetical protein
MNSKFLKISLAMAFTAIAFNAIAQKNYTQGVATYSLSAGGNSGDAQVYFTSDSSVMVTHPGPAEIKLLSNSKGTYFAVLVNVPVASIKKVAVLTPDDIDQFTSAMPKLTFTPGTETKQISGFNCKSVTVKDAKSGNTFTVWVTNDVSAPVNNLTKPFADAGGFPVQFTTIQNGQSLDVTLKSISGEKAPPGTFGIPAGFDKISLDDLKAMGGR